MWRWSELHGLKANLKRLILYYNSSFDFVTLESRFPETLLGCGRMPELTTLWPDRSQNLTFFNSSRKNSINTGLRKEGDEMGNPALMERPGMLPIFYILHDTVCCWLHCLMWLVQEKIGHCVPNLSAVQMVLASLSAHSQNPCSHQKHCKPPGTHPGSALFLSPAFGNISWKSTGTISVQILLTQRPRGKKHS